MKKLPFRPRAVVFDMDGVIVDSMPYHFIAWYEALLPYGVRVGAFDVYLHEGEIWDRTLEVFFAGTGITMTPALSREIYNRRQKVFRRIYKRNIFKGAKELIVHLRKEGYLVALVTGTPTNEIRKILPAGIRKNFHCIVAGDQVTHGKPHPEPYLTAARKLGVKPRDCVVIENGPNGIVSAKKAGMFCIGVTTSLPRPYIRKSDIVLNTLADVDRLLKTEKIREVPG